TGTGAVDARGALRISSVASSASSANELHAVHPLRCASSSAPSSSESWLSSRSDTQKRAREHKRLSISIEDSDASRLDSLARLPISIKAPDRPEPTRGPMFIPRKQV